MRLLACLLACASLDFNCNLLETVRASKVESMISLLGLGECADTIVGNALIRGISGGQKKRVTIGTRANCSTALLISILDCPGEALLTDARVLLLDEVYSLAIARSCVDPFCPSRSRTVWTRRPRSTSFKRCASGATSQVRSQATGRSDAPVR